MLCRSSYGRNGWIRQTLVVSKKIQPEETCGPGSEGFPSLRDSIEVLQVRDLREMRARGAQKCHIPGGMSVGGGDAPQECRLQSPRSDPGNGGQAFHVCGVIVV